MLRNKELNEYLSTCHLHECSREYLWKIGVPLLGSTLGSIIYVQYLPQL